MTSPTRAAPDPRLYAVLAEAGFGADVFNPTQHRSCELVDAYAFARAVELVDGLGLGDALGRSATVEELLAARGFVPGFRVPLRWLLERLAAAGTVAREPGGRWRLAAPLPHGDVDALRAEVLATDPSYTPALALVDAAAALYPAVARGETSGEAGLFRKAALWFAYFSNENGYYAVNNRVAARVAAGRIPPAGARVLEVGAGLGSATEALLEELRRRGGGPSAYHATEPVALFRRRAERVLRGEHPGVPLAFSALDVNRPWAAQGVAPASVDLVWGVNVFHLARRLDAVLREAVAALVPGGSLVVGEGLRPVAGMPVDAELPFQLLESFADVELDAATRPVHGFLTAEEWVAALRRAGFVAVEVVPDPARVRPFYAGFLAGAVSGRRPDTSTSGRMPRAAR